MGQHRESRNKMMLHQNGLVNLEEGGEVVDLPLVSLPLLFSLSPTKLASRAI